MTLDWSKGERYDGADQCTRCKGKGWHFDSHFQAGGSPGVCGFCHCTGRTPSKEARRER